MTHLSRQVVLRVLLCVVAIAMVYVVFIGKPRAERLHRLAASAQQNGSLEKLEQQKRDVLIEQQAVQRQINVLQARQDELSPSTFTAAPHTSHGTPASFVHDVSRRIKDHGLQIVEDDLIDNKHAGRLPVYLHNTSSKPMQWQVTLDGSYVNVTRLLETLARDPRVMLASVTMQQPSLASPIRQWTLTIWLP